MAQAADAENKFPDDDTTDVEFSVSDDKAGVGLDAAKRVIAMYEEAAKQDNFKQFTIALSGGSFPSIFGQGLLAYLKDNPNANIDLSKWHIFWADERVVPLDDKDSSYKSCKEEIFDKFNAGDKKVILDENLHYISIDNDKYKEAIECKDDKEKQSKLNALTEAARSDYDAQISKVFNNIKLPELPCFDVIFLGMGPDGHTASLFPNKEHILGWNYADDDKNRNLTYVLAVIDSPKPPPNRITMSKQVICNAKNVLFVVTGQSKNEVVKDIYHKYHSNEKQTYPAGIVTQDAKNEVVWILDDAAAQALG